MTAARKKAEDERPPARSQSKDPIDSGEFRAIVLGAGGLAVFLYFIKLILLPFALAAILAYVATPLLDWAAKRTRWPRSLFAISLFLLIVGIGVVIGGFAAERIVPQVRSLGGDLQTMVQKLIVSAIGAKQIDLFGHPMNAHEMAQAIMQRVGEWLGQTDQLMLLTGYSIGSIMGVFLTAVLLFYFMVSGRSVANGLLWLVPPHRRPLVERIWARLDPVLLRYFAGVLAVVAYATAASYVGLGVILGIKHAVLLALLTGILETVPVIGPAAAAIAAGLVALHYATGITSILAYALYATVLRLSIDQLFGPIVLGRAAHVHPVLIIFCFLAGGIIYGIPGIILAVPTALLVKSTLATIYRDETV